MGEFNHGGEGIAPPVITMPDQLMADVIEQAFPANPEGPPTSDMADTVTGNAEPIAAGLPEQSGKEDVVTIEHAGGKVFTGTLNEAIGKCAMFKDMSKDEARQTFQETKRAQEITQRKLQEIKARAETKQTSAEPAKARPDKAERNEKKQKTETDKPVDTIVSPHPDEGVTHAESVPPQPSKPVTTENSKPAAETIPDRVPTEHHVEPSKEKTVPRDARPESPPAPDKEPLMRHSAEQASTTNSEQGPEITSESEGIQAAEAIHRIRAEQAAAEAGRIERPEEPAVVAAEPAIRPDIEAVAPVAVETRVPDSPAARELSDDFITPYEVPDYEHAMAEPAITDTETPQESDAAAMTEITEHTDFSDAVEALPVENTDELWEAGLVAPEFSDTAETTLADLPEMLPDEPLLAAEGAEGAEEPKEPEDYADIEMPSDDREVPIAATKEDTGVETIAEDGEVPIIGTEMVEEIVPIPSNDPVEAITVVTQGTADMRTEPDSPPGVAMPAVESLAVPVAADAEANNLTLNSALPAPVKVIEAAITQIHEALDENKVAKIEPIHEIIEKIMKLPTTTEASPEDEAKLDQELEALFTQLFDEANIDYTPELVESFVRLTREHYLEQLWQTVEEQADDEEQLPDEIGTREFLQKLRQSLSQIQKKLRHFYEIGRSALHLYSDETAQVVAT